MNEETEKKLNFYPYYARLLSSRRKTTTIRLGNQTGRFSNGDVVRITVGWNVESNSEIAKARITHIETKRVIEINRDDLEGESPDCRNKGAIIYVLSAIYRRIVSDNDTVTIVKWEYL